MISVIAYKQRYDEFLSGSDSMRVYEGDICLFTSDKPMLAPLFDYIQTAAPVHDDVVIFDRVVGNAAALLFVKVKCSRVYSPVGSELAVKTLNDNGISYHITKIVPFILKPGTFDLCPMEKLSIGKTPDQFLATIKGMNK